MPITFVCPLCRHRVKVSRRHCATERDCPACGRPITVPTAKAPDVEIDEQSDVNPDEETDRPAHAARHREPSAPRVSAAPRPAPASMKRVYALAGGIVLLGVVGAGAILAFVKPPPPPPPPPPPAPDVTPVVAKPVATPPTKKDPALDEAYDRISEARALERAGKELDAESAFERALAATRSADARRILVAARRGFLDRGKDRLLEVCLDVRLQALAGHGPEAQQLVWDYYPHMPLALRPDLEREIAKLNEELVAKMPRGAPRPVALREPAREPSRARPTDERARFAKLELALDDAARRLDADAAERALAEAGSFDDRELVAARDFEVACVKAALDVAKQALAALSAQVGTDIELALWKGAAARGRLVKADSAITIHVAGGGERDLELTELSDKALAALLHASALEEPAQLGLGVIALEHDDQSAALEHFEHATSFAVANALAQRLRETGVKVAAPQPAKPQPEPASRQPSGDITEHWPNGAVKRRYSHDEKGRLAGVCTDFDEQGRPRVKAHYEKGELAGDYLELHPSGKPAKKATFVRGKLQGEVVLLDPAGKVTWHGTYSEGRLLYTRSKDEIVAALTAIESEPIRAPARPANATEFTPLDADAQIKALRRLRAYRWLCGVAPDVGLSWDYAERTTAASQLLQLVGHLDHTPPRPAGCSERLFTFGRTGTEHSNIYQDGAGATAYNSVEAYMFDSDATNVDRVGHRRWCLNPTMLLTGFGAYRDFSAMYAHDSGRQVPTPERVAYPAAGWFPASFIKPSCAWSVSLDPAKYVPPSASGLAVSVFAADESYHKGDEVPLEDVCINTAGMGTPLCVIFRPKASFGAGSSYFVEIRGFKDASGGAVTIEYYVEFFDR